MGLMDTKMLTGFVDGITSLISSIANSRNVTNANSAYSQRVDFTELREIYRSGLGNKICRVKSGYALKNKLIFASKADGEFFNKVLRKKIKQSSKFMMGFGRCIILINEKGADLSSPMRAVPEDYKLDVFSGDMVVAVSVVRDLTSNRYMKPEYYSVNGVQFHPSRVVDFTYEKPTELELPSYGYGGVSEFELVYGQIINDGIVERSAVAMIEKASSFFYKIKGFKEILQSGKEGTMLKFYNATENARSVMGAGLIDAEDDIKVVNQTLTDIDKVDQITLRRLAMVTGIPLAILIGENVKGLNSTGDTEKQVFNEMIETFQGDYLIDPMNELMTKLGKGEVEFIENQNQTPIERLDYETKAIDNASKLSLMGEDHAKYLEERGVIEKEDFGGFFSDENLDDEPNYTEVE